MVLPLKDVNDEEIFPKICLGDYTYFMLLMSAGTKCDLVDLCGFYGYLTRLRLKNFN